MVDLNVIEKEINKWTKQLGIKNRQGPVKQAIKWMRALGTPEDDLQLRAALQLLSMQGKAFSSRL